MKLHERIPFIIIEPDGRERKADAFEVCAILERNGVKLESKSSDEVRAKFSEFWEHLHSYRATHPYWGA